MTQGFTDFSFGFFTGVNCSEDIFKKNNIVAWLLSRNQSKSHIADFFFLFRHPAL